jgi:deoxyribose-phosphate aldolase
MGIQALAKTLDLNVLTPRATTVDLERACADALRHHLASVRSFAVFLPLLVGRLRGSDVRIGTAVGFPHGADLLAAKLAAVQAAVAAGAQELDVMANVPALRSGRARLVRDELARLVRAARAAAAKRGGDVGVRVVIEAPYLDERTKLLACRIVAEVGADAAGAASGVGTQATTADVELMREVLPAEVGVAAAGGARTLEDVATLVNAGAGRVGTSFPARMLQELARGDLAA